MKGYGVRDISDKWEKQQEREKYGKVKKCACGNQTYEKDGVCRICKLNLKMQDAGYTMQDTTPLSPPLVRGDGGIVDHESCVVHREDNGGKRMGTTIHKKCSIEGCVKWAWRGGMCYRHYYISHPEEKKNPGRKKNVISTGGRNLRKDSSRAFGMTDKKNTGMTKMKDSGQAGMTKMTATKSSDNIPDLVARMVAKRDVLKFEIIKIDGALLTLHEMIGVEVPEPEFLREA